MCPRAASEERLDIVTLLQQASCLVQPWVFPIIFQSKEPELIKEMVVSE